MVVHADLISQLLALVAVVAEVDSVVAEVDSVVAEVVSEETVEAEAAVEDLTQLREDLFNPTQELKQLSEHRFRDSIRVLNNSK